MRLDLDDGAAPRGRLLSNGRYTALVTGSGAGCSWLEGRALTAWEADRTEDRHGLFIYLRDVDLRDVDGGGFWSVGRSPVGAGADEYEAFAGEGVVTIRRTDHGIAAALATCVDPDRDREARVLTLENRSANRRRIEVTTAAELVLQPLAAHQAHPAFSRLFLQTSTGLRRRALVASRRPRQNDEPTPWMAQALCGPGRLEFETDRARFVGRGRTMANPAALAAASPLAGSIGNVLDPVFAERRVVTLEPGKSARVTAVVAAGATRDHVLELVGESSPRTWKDVLARAAARERDLRQRLGLDADVAESLQDLAVAMLYGSCRSALQYEALRRAARPVAALGRFGVRTGTPRVVAEPSVDARPLVNDLRAARVYWQAHGFDVDVVLVCDDPAMIGLSALVAEGVTILTRTVLGDHLDTLRASASLLVSDSLEAPAAAQPEVRAEPSYRRATTDFASAAKAPAAEPPTARELVIRLDGSRPPMPWINVLANERFGFLASESGAGYTWSRNSRLYRITPWSNDPVSDPFGEALYLRDEDSRTFWSPLPGPIRGAGVSEVRHALGESRWRQESHGLVQTVSMFVPRTEPVKVVRLTLDNADARPRRLSVFWYARLVLGGLPSETAGSIVTVFDSASSAVFARNPQAEEFADGVVFAAAVAPNRTAAPSFTCDRTAFLGRGGSPEDPAALRASGRLDGRNGTGLDPCAALAIDLEVPAHGSIECAFLLGEAAGEESAREIIRRFRDPAALDESAAGIRSFWESIVSAVQVETPSAAIDVMMNGWLLYQTLACRLWARSAFFQSGGAFGFRDQLQDSAALVYARPDLTRAQILLHSAHQFVEGDVLHWWHPPADRGTRTRFSDDLLWLPYITSFYVGATGDESVLDESIGFVAARLLEPGEDEAYLATTPAGASATVYEHCCVALDRSLTRGPHGLPLMGTGDWNDGMNRVGREGRGESVWLGFFLYDILGGFAPLSAARGDGARAAKYREYRDSLRNALEDAAWDGGWYRRAWYDDGTPLGSASSDECRIDALAQAWSVISGAGSAKRTARAMRAVERMLVSERDGIIRLLAPPFDRTPHDPGYIKGYVPGIRENGGQYTHAALWVVRAMAELGRRDRAARWLEMLSPVSHAETAEQIRVYQVEPHVVAADVYGAPPHVGRGGWTWYTGSAAWMYRVGLESILGITLEGGEALRIDPRIPDDWPGFRVKYRLPDGVTTYDLHVRNPEGNAAAVVAATLDGAPLSLYGGRALVPIRRDGGSHDVEITLGAALPQRGRRM